MQGYLCLLLNDRDSDCEWIQMEELLVCLFVAQRFNGTE